MLLIPLILCLLADIHLLHIYMYIFLLRIASNVYWLYNILYVKESFVHLQYVYSSFIYYSPMLTLSHMIWLSLFKQIESWLVRIGDAFLQGHQDPGGSLSLARDFLHLHQTLNNDVMVSYGNFFSISDTHCALCFNVKDSCWTNFK